MNDKQDSYYAKVADYYDEDATLGFEARANVNTSLDRIRNDFRKITTKYEFNDALEIGCGPGFDVHWFASTYPDKNFAAVDISEEMVKLAQKRLNKDQLKNARVIQSDERSLIEKFGENSFDLIYVYFGALNTVEDLNFSSIQIHKLLRPNGIAVLTFVNKWYLRELLVQLLKLNFKIAFARIGKVWGGYSVNRFLQSHCYSPNIVKKAFSQFTFLEHKGYSILYPPWYNDHKIRNNKQKADKLWNLDQKLQKTNLWSKGEYTLFVFQK
ncbi:MAG: class I SAM-dependent methyltransferase [Bacteroidetes bacterium]|nr:class I SAM-dependent methyltransferase [Bacteroidota bacterium]